MEAVSSAVKAMATRDPNILINPSARLTFRLTYRIKNRGYQAIELDLADEQHRELARLIKTAEGRDEPLVVDPDTVDEDTLEFLRELGLVVSEAEIPQPAGASIHLATLFRRARTCAEYDHPEPLDARRARVNGAIWPAAAAAACIPAQWYGASAELLGIDEQTLYVQDPETLFTSPVNLHDASGRTGQGPERASAARLDEALAELRAQRCRAEDLPPDVFAALAGARILVPQDARADRRTGAWAAQLAERGYAVLRNVIPPAFAESLREYCWSLLDGGWLQRGDGQVARRWFRHNDPVFRAVHQALVPLVNRITTAHFTAVKATYAYLGIYETDAALARHRDRPQCRWNLSMLLGSRPHRPRARQWPIYLQLDGEPKAVALGVSDALLYAGQETPHWREPLTDMNHYAACFFHFVDWDFTGGLT